MTSSASISEATSLEPGPVPTVMAIGPERFTRRIEAVAGTSVLTPDSVFDAVGEFMLGKAARGAITMFVTSDQLRHGTDVAVTTLRAVMPGLRLVVVVPTSNGSARKAPHPLAGIVDAVLFEPVSDAELKKALDADIAPATPTRAREKQADVKREALTQATDEARQAKEATTDKAARRVSTRPSAEVEPIGDTDLIQEIMFGPDALARRALALIRQQTGWPDVRLVDGVDAPDEPSALVKYGSDSFGALVAPDAETETLQSWANWLARWLALDRSYREFRLLTYRDDLTRAWNRRFFDAFLAETLQRASQRRRPVTVMVFDLDGFKKFNDKYGHEAGDEILRETVRLLNSVIRKGDRVCRIGGDEFAVVFGDLEGPRTEGSQHPETVEEIASRFQDQICQLKFPKLGTEAPGTLSISAGLATYPWDGATASDLLRKADHLALESKRRGKNVITFGPGAAEVCKRKPGADRREV